MHPYIRYIREGSITTSESIDRLTHGYGTVILELLHWGDDARCSSLERKWLHEDIVSLAQITLGEASKSRILLPSSKEMLTRIRGDLRAHHLHLGIPFTLYTIKNRLL